MRASFWSCPDTLERFRALVPHRSEWQGVPLFSNVLTCLTRQLRKTLLPNLLKLVTPREGSYPKGPNLVAEDVYRVWWAPGDW